VACGSAAVDSEDLACYVRRVFEEEYAAYDIADLPDNTATLKEPRTKADYRNARRN